MAQALSDMGTNVLKGVGCSVIGVSEVENDRVLSDLCDQPVLKARGFKFCHVEGPDRRGVDCGLLYNPVFFKVLDVKALSLRTHRKGRRGFPHAWLSGCEWCAGR